MERNQIKSINQLRLSNFKLSILFWNIEGTSKIFSLPKNDQMKLLDNQVICLYETWHTSPLSLPLFNRFDKAD